MRAILPLFGCLGAALLSAAPARATIITLEAEGARAREHGTITSPLLIKDDDLASDGSYVEVLAGYNSLTTMPADEGVLELRFDQPDAPAVFAVWARVITPTTSDDSVWMKVDNGSAVAWNNIPLGSSWHWVQLPSLVTLASGAHSVRLAYREDGAKLDQLLLTTELDCNPSSGQGCTRLSPTVNDNYRANTELGGLVSWAEVPGASSYSVMRSTGTGDVPVGPTNKRHTQALPEDGGSYYVVAHFGDGGITTSGNASIPYLSYFQDAYLRPSSYMSFTPPMDDNLAVPVGTASAYNAPSAHGRARYDFRTATAATINVWASVSAPSLTQDSYWVRVDQGAWVKWNNIPNYTCSRVRNSDAGEVLMNYVLSAGSHTVEFAYREAGASLGTLALMGTNGTNIDPCSD